MLEDGRPWCGPTATEMQWVWCATLQQSSPHMGPHFCLSHLGPSEPSVDSVGVESLPEE